MNVEVNVENGIWTCDRDAHSFDEPLARAISSFLRNEHCTSVIDMGCGGGHYVKHLKSTGLKVLGIDGNPKTHEFTEDCIVGDLTGLLPLLPFKADWLICLEVGEHIPPQYETMFIDNLCQNLKSGLIISWFPTEGHGIGHFNPRSNEYVKDKLLDREFISDEMAQKNLRDAATLWWFKESLMVFRRV